MLSTDADAEQSEGKDLTDANQGIGTPRYMPLEQLQNNDVGPHSDVYAVGLVLYEMLVGQPAIKGRTNYEIILDLVDRIQPFLERFYA